MTLLFLFLTFALGLQLAMFFLIRERKKKEKDNSMLLKYEIKSRADAFKTMNDLTIPEKDRLEIERLYQGEKKGLS